MWRWGYWRFFVDFFGGIELATFSNGGVVSHLVAGVQCFATVPAPPPVVKKWLVLVEIGSLVIVVAKRGRRGISEVNMRCAISTVVTYLLADLREEKSLL